MFIATLVASVVLAAAAVFAVRLALRSHWERKCAKRAWQSRLKVLELEQQVVKLAPDSPAEAFIVFLADIVFDESRMRQVHEQAQNYQRTTTTTESELDAYFAERFDRQHLKIVKDAVLHTAIACRAIGHGAPEQNERRDNQATDRALCGETPDGDDLFRESRGIVGTVADQLARSRESASASLLTTQGACAT